ncbi:GAF domain-containing protein [Deinococcus cellulosilyticus]|uniref:GAF domain-containing protein n=1 Tax=Deinococcus cellulosilyticus (strain DSM 18568 / NBRC 106333 / KACC 11606 / 5516J-15) TaxID=1223518 RepID=A0A511NAG2_DEIC1|nr:GAF domain-containing protein [Deinococcus cellulosilyticus]GEM49557.1 hypothetical protein DC3_51920 [Deinococcus cellulosilyticus NBRC 106333 = KACC 11606]
MQKSKTANTLKSTLMLLLAGLLLPLLWPGVLLNLLKSVGIETGHDHDWSDSLVVLQVGSDLLTFLAYTAIASTLGVLVFQNRKQIPFHRILLSFGLFIVACGLTHLMHVVTRYSPVNDLDAYIRAVTAIVSVITAVALPPMLPRVRSLLEAQQVLRHKQLELESSRQALEEQNRALQRAHLDLLEARDHAEFHASLGDLLQTVHDPDVLADQALEKLGPALKAEQITLIRIQQGRAKLWHAWGDFKPALIAFLMGEGTPIEDLVVLRNVVQTAQRYYTQQYSDIAGARNVSEHRISAAFEPIVKPSGEVVAVIAFSRSVDLPWTEQEQVLAARAASILAVALDRTELQMALQAQEQALLEAQQWHSE